MAQESNRHFIIGGQSDRKLPTTPAGATKTITLIGRGTCSPADFFHFSNCIGGSENTRAGLLKYLSLNPACQKLELIKEYITRELSDLLQSTNTDTLNVVSDTRLVINTLPEDVQIAIKAIGLRGYTQNIQRDQNDVATIEEGIKYAIDENLFHGETRKSDISITPTIVNNIAGNQLATIQDIGNAISDDIKENGGLVAIDGDACAGKGTSVEQLAQYLRDLLEDKERVVTLSNGDYFRLLLGGLIMDYKNKNGEDFDQSEFIAYIKRGDANEIISNINEKITINDDGLLSLKGGNGESITLDQMRNGKIFPKNLNDIFKPFVARTQHCIINAYHQKIKDLTKGGKIVIIEGRRATLDYLTTAAGNVQQFVLKSDKPQYLSFARIYGEKYKNTKGEKRYGKTIDPALLKECLDDMKQAKT